MRPAAILVLALLGTPAAAETGLPTPSFLPPVEKILETLEASPPLMEARAKLGGAQAQARMLAAGEHETTFTAALDDRQVRGFGSYSEWSLQAARGLRLPGKASLDRAAGQAGVQAAHNGVDDAWHQTSLDLVQRYLAWVEAAEVRVVDAEELETYGRETRALARRVELQDAALLDLEQARGAEARARAALAHSQGAERVARAELEARYPGLGPQIAPLLPAPSDPARPLPQWADLIVQRSHELIIARALADRERLLARRFGQDQIPDPTIGVRTFNERGGEETGVGVFISAPLGGARRSAVADQQYALASAAEARLAMISREVRARAQTDVIAVSAALEAWRDSALALDAAQQASRRIGRAYDLGERNLTDRLLADRQTFEARRIELSARAQAHRALLELALDAHELWLMDED
jgi:outer membrane protein TolC